MEQSTGPSIAPGDRVVALAASLRSAALVSGAISCSITVWILRQSVMWSAAALGIGATAGAIVGLVLGLLLYPAAAGQVVIVKVAPESQAAILRAALLGAVIAGAVVAAATAGILEAATRLPLLAGIGCVTGLVVGGLLAYLASR